DVRKGFLSRSGRAFVVFCLSFLSRVGRRQFRRVHALAAGAVSYGVPRQRICLFYLARAFCSRRDNISRGRRRRTLRLAGSSCRHDLDRLCGRLAARSFRRGNSRRMLARLTPHVGENMTEVASKVFPIEKLREFCIRVFLHCGVPKADATQAADVLACADLRGVDSHCVARLYSYFGMLSEGHINPKPRITTVRSTLSTATIDGDNGLGLVVGPQANRIAMDMADKAGSGWVSVCNTNHFGIAGYYVLQALERDLIGWAMTNSTSLVTPLWGMERMLGTNPIAIAFPGKEEPPIVIDMATSAAAFGKIEMARRTRQAIPSGWAIDSQRRARP